jgi:hypothetical protein
MFPTEQELKIDMGLTYTQFENIIQNFGDDAVLFHFPGNDMEEVGIMKGVKYVMIQSLYPTIFPLIKKEG